MTPTLNIIGCGKLGQTLARLWHDQQLTTVLAVLNRTPDSSQKACDFIGAGSPGVSIASLPAADIWLIATPDTDIEACANALQSLPTLRPDDILLHCSGSLNSQVLKGSITQQILSVHPVHSFAEPSASIQNFSGSFCGIEGDAAASVRIAPLFEAIGGQLFNIDNNAKTLYHSATVLACNALVGLLDSSLECFQAAGVDQGLAQKILLPIVQQTVNNTLKSGAISALTGPVSRGDVETVSTQLSELSAYSPQITNIYRSLGLRTVDIAEQKNLDPVTAESLNNLFAQ